MARLETRQLAQAFANAGVSVFEKVRGCSVVTGVCRSSLVARDHQVVQVDVGAGDPAALQRAPAADKCWKTS